MPPTAGRSEVGRPMPVSTTSRNSPQYHLGPGLGVGHTVGHAPASAGLALCCLFQRLGVTIDGVVHGVNLRHQTAGGLDEPGDLVHIVVEHHEDRNCPGAMLGQESIGQGNIVVPVEHLQVDLGAAVGKPQNHRGGADGVAAPVGGEHGQVDGTAESIHPFGGV